MFLGHMGAAFIAKKVEPKMNLAVALIGAQFTDLIWPIFILIGMEKVNVMANNMEMMHLEFVLENFESETALQI